MHLFCIGEQIIQGLTLAFNNGDRIIYVKSSTKKDKSLTVYSEIIIYDSG